MHQSGSVSLCRSAISVLVATALYSPIALASTVEYGETVDGVVLEKDIQLVYGTANNTKINPGGEQHIKEFGVSNNTEINGGYQYIEMNGAAEYSVLNDGYQIVQMGGAANQTTLNNGVLQVYGAANDTTIKGGRLIVEKDGGAVFVAIEKGGLLEVKEGVTFTRLVALPTLRSNIMILIKPQETTMPEATPFQVMIVDDHPLMRRGVRQLLELDPGFEVVAEAGDGASAIDLANRLDIDVILLDLNMKGMSGLDTLNALRRDGVTAQIIILTVSDASSDVFALIDAGADGYLLKDSDPEVLLEAIRAGAKGSKVFSERVNQYLREREMFGAEEDPFSVLTERELDVLHELAQGLSNKQIASVLNISEQTVKVHIRNLLRKLNVRSRVAATILFLQQRGAQ